MDFWIIIMELTLCRRMVILVFVITQNRYQNIAPIGKNTTCYKKQYPIHYVSCKVIKPEGKLEYIA
jgi:hypothetical protein